MAHHQSSALPWLLWRVRSRMHSPLELIALHSISGWCDKLNRRHVKLTWLKVWNFCKARCLVKSVYGWIYFLMATLFEALHWSLVYSVRKEIRREYVVCTSDNFIIPTTNDSCRNDIPVYGKVAIGTLTMMTFQCHSSGGQCWQILLSDTYVCTQRIYMRISLFGISVPNKVSPLNKVWRWCAYIAVEHAW